MMKTLHIQLLLVCFVIGFLQNSISQNTITLDTIVSNNQLEPALLTKVGDRLAWADNEKINLYQDGNIDSLITPGDFYSSSFKLTETTVSWAANSIDFMSGFCGNNVPYGYYYLDGNIILDNLQCVNYLISNGINTIRTYWNNGTQMDILGPDHIPFFSLTSPYQGFSFSIPSGGSFSYWGDDLFFKSFIDDANGNLISALFHYDVKNDVLLKIFDTANYIYMPSYKNDHSYVFSVSPFNNFQTDLYYYDGQATTLIATDANLWNGLALTFQDRIVWPTLEGQLIQYQNGVFDTLVDDNISFASVNASDCYLGWATTDFINNTSTYNLYDGATIQTLHFNGFQNSHWNSPLDNDGFALVLNDLNTDLFSIIRGSFRDKCCTAEDIVTAKNADEFSHTFIESTAVFTCNTSPTYQALDYIELNPGFCIPGNYTFDAIIEGNCILYND